MLSASPNLEIIRFRVLEFVRALNLVRVLDLAHIMCDLPNYISGKKIKGISAIVLSIEREVKAYRSYDSIKNVSIPFKSETRAQAAASIARIT